MTCADPPFPAHWALCPKLLQLLWLSPPKGQPSLADAVWWGCGDRGETKTAMEVGELGRGEGYGQR